MIVRITFENKKLGTRWMMLFGDSYKKWYMQAHEYMGHLVNVYPKKDVSKIVIVNASRSRSPWIGWGGLKWCSHEEFQGELNREGCQDDDPDNPNPRQYKDMTFESFDILKVRKLLNL